MGLVMTIIGFLLLGLIKVHGLFDLVVSGDLEGNDLQGDEPGRHGEDLGSVGGLVQVLARLWVGHARRVPAHDVEVGPSHHPRPAVPLHLWINGDRLA